jgi:hypothetical protein
MVSLKLHPYLGRYLDIHTKHKERGELEAALTRENTFDRKGALNKVGSARRKWATDVFPGHHAGPKILKVSEAVPRS